MKDAPQSLHTSRIQGEIRLHIQSIELFSAVQVLRTEEKRKYIEIYEKKIMALLAELATKVTAFEYDRFITSDETIYNINKQLKDK